MLNQLEPAPADAIHQWRRQIGQRRRQAIERGPRPFAVISYWIRGRTKEPGLVDLKDVTVTVLYDVRTADGEPSTRLVGIGAQYDGTVLRFGGPGLVRFDKELRLSPAAGAVGKRLDAQQGPLLWFALTLERHLERCARHPHMPRRNAPLLPTHYQNRFGKYQVSLLEIPKRQVIRLQSPERDLCGHTGTIAFDFFHTA